MTSHVWSHPVRSAMIAAICTIRCGVRPSRSHDRQDSVGRPQATAASFTLPHFMYCLTSARRAPNVASFGVHPLLVSVTPGAVICTP